jgi:4'-phosphopantetheinyl transferase
VINWPEIDYSLTDSRIDLWFVRLSFGAPLLPYFRLLLGPEETARAHAFRCERLRQNFTVVHGILRELVGRYLGEEAAKLRFSAGRNGKLHIVPPGEVQFNLSHSDDIAMFGFTATGEVGVDVEKIRPLDDFLDIANRFFCPDETRDLMSCLPDERQRAFFRCWTRKEAYLKAVGGGLQIPLNSFRVSLTPWAPVRLLEVNGGREGAERWMLHSPEFSPSCCAAVAYPAPARTIRLMYCGPELAEPR